MDANCSSSPRTYIFLVVLSNQKTFQSAAVFNILWLFGFRVLFSQLFLTSYLTSLLLPSVFAYYLTCWLLTIKFKIPPHYIYITSLPNRTNSSNQVIGMPVSPFPGPPAFINNNYSFVTIITTRFLRLHTTTLFPPSYKLAKIFKKFTRNDNVTAA